MGAMEGGSGGWRWWREAPVVGGVHGGRRPWRAALDLSIAGCRRDEGLGGDSGTIGVGCVNGGVRLDEPIERATSFASRATSPLLSSFSTPSRALARLKFCQACSSRATSRLGSIPPLGVLTRSRERELATIRVGNRGEQAHVLQGVSLVVTACAEATSNARIYRRRIFTLDGVICWI
jgi:hypothetical protein